MTRPTDLELRVQRTLRDTTATADLARIVDGAMARIETTAQRPAALIPGWWIGRRSMVPAAVSGRWAATLLAAMLLIALLVGVAIVASQPRRPEPFGPAEMGWLVQSSGGDLVLFDVRTGSSRRLTTSAAGEWGPVFSRDGRWIAYWTRNITSNDRPGVCAYGCGSDARMRSTVDIPDGASRRSDLVVMDLQDETTGTVATGIWPTSSIDWSPDGEHLAFSALVDDRPVVLVADRRGAGATVVGPPGLGGAFPRWSPDGATIAFKGGANDAERGIYLMRPDGSDLRRITTANGVSGGPTFDAMWSPDGRRIAFVAGFGWTFDIWVVNADGSGERRITSDPSRIDDHPRWSPDGARLAFIRQVSNWQATVVIVDPDQVGSERQFDEPVDDSAPEWSPDGTRIYGSTRSDPALHEDDGLIILDPSGIADPVIIPVDDGGGTASWQRLAP